MTGGAPSPFQLAEIKLRELGIALTRLPGEYRVNFRGGADATARTLETLEEALAAGQQMAAERAEAIPTNRGRRRYRRPRRMTPKAHNRRLRMAHLRRLRARALKQQRDEQSDR